MKAVELNNISKLFSIPHERKRTLFHWLSSLGKGKYDFEPFYALKDVSLSVEEGEFLGVIGRNGSGKSTLLKIISRIYRPTTGKVNVKGNIFPLLELGVGFQPEFSCKENIFFYGSTLGFTRKQLRSRLDAIISFAELERFVDAKLMTLSSGMIMRLAFSIAVQSDAPIFLVDEGLAVGDRAFWGKCEAKFTEYKAHGKTIIYVSHDLSSVQKFCRRVLVLEQGQLYAEGSPEEMISLYTSQIVRS
jgi:ABC-type polysaccharide/polyol phosphate transport system ATPase subunit